MPSVSDPVQLDLNIFFDVNPGAVEELRSILKESEADFPRTLL